MNDTDYQRLQNGKYDYPAQESSTIVENQNYAKYQEPAPVHAAYQQPLVQPQPVYGQQPIYIQPQSVQQQYAPSYYQPPSPPPQQVIYQIGPANHVPVPAPTYQPYHGAPHVQVIWHHYFELPPQQQEVVYLQRNNGNQCNCKRTMGFAVFGVFLIIIIVNVNRF